MKITKTFPRIGLSVVLSLTFFLLPFSSVNVSASGSNNEGDFWQGFYVEHVTKEISGNAVNIGNAENTDYGISTGNYIYNKSGVTTQDVIDYVSDQYNNATGYVVESARDYADKVENVLNRTIDGTLSAGYKAEKALRTVVDSAGNVYYNVSSSDYWNGIYNRWFNNGGYKDQYVTKPDDSYTGTTTNGSFNINFIGIGSVDTNSGLLTGTTNAYNSGSASMSNLRGQFICSVSVNNNSGFFSLGHGWAISNGWTCNSVSYSHNDNSILVSVTFTTAAGTQYTDSNYLYLTNTITNGSAGGGQQLQPSQVGFIQYPLGGKTPIYTDPTLNPSDWTINDNGTITVDGNDYPALIDEKEIDDNGWLDMLNLLDGEDRREMSLKDPWGFPWDTQDDGTVLGGFFGNLVKDVQKMFKGVGDTIKKIFEKPIDVVTDLVEKIKKALKEFIGDFIDFDTDIFDIDVENNYGIIDQIFQNLLECFGLGDS